MNNWITSLLLMVPFLISAQSGTTLEEYRFLSKGYAYQKSMGLDASKAGYEIKSLRQATEDVEYIGMYMIGERNPQAILLVLQPNTVEPTYICLPNNQADSRVMELHTMDREQISDPAIWELYDDALRALVFSLLGEEQEQVTPSVSTIREKAKKSIAEELADEPIEKPKVIKTEDIANSIPSSYEFTERSISKTRDDVVNNTVAVSMDEALTKRGVLHAPIINGTYPAKGKVAVKFCVDKSGKVSSAKFTQLGSTTFNQQLIQKAIDSVQQAAFAESVEAKECGKAVFTFQ